MQLTAIIDIACAVFTIITIARNFGLRRISKSGRLLNICLAVMVVALLVDAGAYVITGPSYPLALRYMLNLLAFTVVCINAIAFSYYLEALFEENGKRIVWPFRLLNVVEYVWLACDFYEYIAGNLVTYGTDGMENVNMVYPIYIVAMSFAVTAITIGIILAGRRAIGRRLTTILVIFNIIPIINTILFAFIGIDLAYALSSLTLALVCEFVQRDQSLEQLDEAKRREMLAENSTRLFALEDNFESMYDVELESGRYTSFVKGDFYRTNIYDRLVSPNEFFEDLKTNINAVICEEDREGVFAFLNRKAISESLAKSEHVDHYYRLMTENGTLWFRMRVVYKDNDKKSVIIGVFNAEEEMAAKMADEERLRAKELELRHSEFRASALSYAVENEGDVSSFLDFFAGKLRELIGSDQVIYRDAKGTMFINNAPDLGAEYEIPIEYCRNCGHYDIFSPVYDKGVAEMSDARNGINGIKPSEKCPVKSSLTRIVYEDGKVAGYLAIHYILHHHDFNDYERRTLEDFAGLLSLLLSRYAAREENAQLSKELELRRQIESNMQMIGGLASGYNALYYINIDEHILNIFALDEEKYPGSRAIFETDNPDFYGIIGGYGLSDQVHPDDRYLFEDFTPEGIREKLKDRKRYSMRFRAKTSDGYRWDEMELIKYEPIDEQANAVAVGFTDRDADIRREQEYQQQLEVAREEADAANQSKTNFLFNMSHDIRTPMNAIRGFTAMAKKNAGNKEKVTEYLEKIDISGQQLLTLINQVLEMARIESGKIELDEKPINIREEFYSMVTVLDEQARSNGLTFTHSLENIEHNDILADESRMGSITLNIVGNAMKYTPSGGNVDFRLKEIPCDKPGYGRYTFTVTDTGIGMSDEYQKKLFQPFEREKSSTVSKIQGTGLGLSIVKNIVDLIGGTIEVNSELNKGTRFDITLDFKINEGAVHSPEESDSHEIVSFKGRRVLLVEDNEMNREIARDILEEQGLIVEDAEDGDIAVAMVQEAIDRGEFHYYDFILMDVQMPRMTGYEATKAIRDIPGPDGVHIPIIAMTANAFEEDRKNALAAGMDDHLSKPIDVHKLFRTLARFAK